MPGVRRSTRRAAADVELVADILRAANGTSEQKQAASRLLAWAAKKQQEAATDDAEAAAAEGQADEPREEREREPQQEKQDRHQHQQQQQQQQRHQQQQQQQQAQQQQRQPHQRERAHHPETGVAAAANPDDASGEAAHDDAQDHAEQQPPQQRLPSQPQQIQYTAHAWDADAARRRGPFHRNQCGTGFAANSARALHVARNIATVCRAPGCGALVDLKSATEQARTAQRQHYEPGDGCAADWADPPCSSCCNRSRFKKRQRQFAQQVEDGDRILVEWPPAVERHARLQHVADAERAKHLERVRRKLGD